MTVVASDGRQREQVSRKVLLMWLATLNANKVKNPSAQAAIERYQLGVMDIIDAYFDEHANQSQLANVDRRLLFRQLDRLHQSFNLGLVDRQQAVDIAQSTWSALHPDLALMDYRKTNYPWNQRSLFEAHNDDNEAYDSLDNRALQVER